MWKSIAVRHRIKQAVAPQRHQVVSSKPIKREAVAADPKAPANLLRMLAKDDNPDVRRAVASNPNTPLEVLWPLAKDHPKAVISNSSLRLHIATDLAVLPNAPETSLQALFTQEEAPTSWLRWGSEHGNWWVRQVVAANPSTPSEALSKLAEDKDSRGSSRVRKAVARNPAVPLPALQCLATDADAGIRKIVAENSAASEVVAFLCKAGANRKLQKVGDDPKPLTQAEQERLMTWGPYGRWLLAVHPGTSSEDLAALSTDENENVREAVAKNPSAPHHVLQKLTNDSEWRVRAAVAENSSASGKLLKQLISDRDPFVYQAARSNPNAPKDM